MKTIKFSFIALVLACVTLFFASCDEIDELTTVEVELGEVPFEIPLDLQPSTLRSTTENEFVSFSGKSEPLSLQNSMFQKLQDYDVSSVVFIVTEVKIRITTTSESGGTTVTDFTSEATGAGKELSYTKEGNIDLGIEYGDAKLTEYMKSIFSAIQDKKTVVVNVAGQTDIVPSEIDGAELTVVTMIPTIKAKVKVI